MKVDMNNIILKHGDVEISICQHKSGESVTQEIAILPNYVLYKYDGTLLDFISLLQAVEEGLNVETNSQK